MTELFEIGEDALFEIEAPPPITLADKFGLPPMSVLDRRTGEWQQRRRRWLALGIRSELGRDLEGRSGVFNRTDPFATFLRTMWYSGSTSPIDGTSIFDPVVCELTYRWFTRQGDRILDPFAGGSVRGIAASVLGRFYTGIDLRPEQVAANLEQIGIAAFPLPRWIAGDSLELDALLHPELQYDLVFSCPPYADLEVYSDDPRDLSRMKYAEFSDAHEAIIRAATARLREDRFAAWVISDVRDGRGAYRGLVAETVRAFMAAGLSLHNDAVLLDQLGIAALRAERPFRATRKLTRVHQHLLIFCKGNPKKAATRLETGA